MLNCVLALCLGFLRSRAGRISAIFAQMSKARLGENNNDSKLGFVRPARSGESISPKRENEKL